MGAETQDPVRYVPPDCSAADRAALKRLGYEVREEAQMNVDGVVDVKYDHLARAVYRAYPPRKPQD